MPYRNIILAALLLFCSATLAAARVDSEVALNFKADAPVRDIASSTDGQWLFVLTDGGKVNVYAADGTLNDVIRVDPAMDRISVAGLQLGGIDDKVAVSSSRTNAVQVLAVSFAAQLDTAGAPFLGPANAPVTVAVFSDFECPYCAQVGPLLERILQNNPTTVKVVFKHFPLTTHKYARAAALAAMAAQKQGKFWEMHDHLFENQKNLSPERIRALARELKLDLAQFDKDQTSIEAAQRLEKDLNDGRRAGVRGTPVLFVNGRRVKERDAGLIQRMINEEVKGRK